MIKDLSLEKEIKNKYSFFKNAKNIEFLEKQRENKKSKFFLKVDGNYYTLICDTIPENEKMVKNIEILSKILNKNVPQIIYKDKEYKYIVTDYVGDGNGKSFYQIEQEGLKINYEKYAEKINDLIIKLHNYEEKDNENSIQIPYKNWYRSVYMEFYTHCRRLINIGLLEKQHMDIVMAFLKQNKENLKAAKTCYIHGDLTPRNVCLNMKTDDVYLIDFDMFQKGDLFIDTQKIIWTKQQSKVFDIYVKKYCKTYKEEIYLLYWLKIKLFWLPFAYRNKVDYRDSLQQTIGLINQAKKYLK